MKPIAGTDWTEAEVEACVASYFEHLPMALRRQPFVKSHLYKRLASQIGRTEKSIEFKFQNISAILEVLGREWMPGLAPARNYQELLAERVAARISTFDLLELPLASGSVGAAEGFSESSPGDFDVASFYLEPAPELRAQREQLPDFIRQLVRKFDPSLRDARNRQLGWAGEKFVLEHERRFLSEIGKPNLAERVRWVAQEDGDGAGYDIASFDENGRERFLEVKTTVGGARTSFIVTRNEYEFSKTSSEHYALIRLFNFRQQVRGFELAGDISRFVALTAASYRADFGG